MGSNHTDIFGYTPKLKFNFCIISFTASSTNINGRNKDDSPIMLHIARNDTKCKLLGPKSCAVVVLVIAFVVFCGWYQGTCCMLDQYTSLLFF